MRFQTLVADCRKVIAAAEKHEVELPSLGCFRVALEEALEDLTVSKTRQINLEAKLRETTVELHANLAIAREARSRLRSYVKAAFGWNDERLADFGMNPGSQKRRKCKGAEVNNGSPGYH
jgi:hypothetical protein